MRPELDDLLAGLASCDQLVHLERIPPRPPRVSATARPLPAPISRLVPEGGLWTHQAAAIDLARDGHSVAVATGTASGKSLCYQLPIAEAVLDSPPGTALLIFPTKALAQDQLRALGAMDLPGLVPVTYDGDTPAKERTWARRHANVVLTNPDMLHVGILPHHGGWSTFMAHLRYVVLDELHTLRGIFGSHVAHLLRRLRRLCAHYGSEPTFVFGSATIGKPAELASALCGLEVAAVGDDGSPRGERLFALWNPPLTDSRAGTRASSNAETAEVLSSLVTAGYRGIAFARSRKGSELVASYAKRRLPPELSSMVRPYRGGYLAAERREIETELFEGRLAGVVATSALELGIDVGTLDACILNGFPGTIASMWQQAGRAGRSRQRSLAVLVAGEDQLDQWLMAHPTEVFVRPPEPAVVNPANPFVLLPHVACAAYEKPLVPDDEAFWADLGDGVFEDAVRALAVDDRLRVRGGRAFFAGPGAPAPGVGLRTGSSTDYAIVDTQGRLIGTVDENRAFSLVHPGALYLHQGKQYRVATLDVDDRAAIVTPSNSDEYTQARTDTDVRIASTDDSKDVGRVRLSIGAVEVTEQVVAYQRKHLFTGEVLGVQDLDLPPSRLVTRAFWYTVGDDVLASAGLVQARVPGTVHAVEHAGIGILPLFTICDRWDVGGVSTNWQSQTGAATIVIYDGYPGGAGIAELGFAAGRRHLEATLEVVSSCPCQSGCPSCVQSPKCGNWNEPLDKAGAVALLGAILGAVGAVD
ncbi:MAG: DEAD/DEAH box helicase [Acidimicrobiia bacterium]|nr:DEAD/DEAH box helicase [Acidimicrobiia bacterium]